ncbi:solute carrier family 22 member 6-like [Amblyomma americanum]
MPFTSWGRHPEIEVPSPERAFRGCPTAGGGRPPLGTTVYGHGHFQRVICCFAAVSLVVLQCHGRAFALITRPVDHWCRPPAEFAVLSVPDWKNVGVPLDEKGRASECLAYVQPGQQPNDTETYECDAWDYDPVRAAHTARSYWDLVCHRSWLVNMGNAVFMSGAVLLVPFAGIAADMFGRETIIMLGVAALLSSTVCTCVAHSYAAYLVASFVNSACASSTFVISLILMYEVAPLNYRAFYIAVSCSLGVLLVDVFVLVLALFPLSWHMLQGIVLSPTALLLIGPCVVFESPLWLLAASRVDEAEAVMLKAAKMNDMHRAVAKQAMMKVRSQLNRVEKNTDTSRSSSLMHSFEGGNYLVRVFFVAFSLMLGFYGLSWSSRMRNDTRISFLAVVLSAPSYVAMYLALISLGRLQLLVATMALMGGTCSLFGIAIYANPRVVGDALLVLAQCCARVMVPAGYLYMAELFPTSVRSIVMCGAYACGRLGAVAASVLSLLEEFGREDLEFAIMGSAVFGGVAALLGLPETSHGLVDYVHAAGSVEEDMIRIVQGTPDATPIHRPSKRRKRSKTNP